MAKKTKSTDKPKKVNIYFDRLSIQMGFMNYEMCGFLLKMIVYYSMGLMEDIERVKEDLNKRFPDLSGMVLMAFEENKVAIDEDLKAYADVCEIRRQAVAKREQYKREKQSSIDNKEDQMISNDNTRCQMISNTNTNTNTNSSGDDNIKDKEKPLTYSADGDDFHEFVRYYQTTYPIIKHMTLERAEWEKMTMTYTREWIEWALGFIENDPYLSKKNRLWVTLQEVKGKNLSIDPSNKKSSENKANSQGASFVSLDVENENIKASAQKKMNESKKRIISMLKGEYSQRVASIIIGMFSNGEMAKYGLVNDYNVWLKGYQEWTKSNN